ncbi:autotransporter assembly complex protein TamA, partial [Marinobacter alexandrii]|uniref:autotransporter assembly complex protein TamA n=1 Tax=Marinobacter alexandrii TaxID=2570351 RepID=UPI003299C7F6
MRLSVASLALLVFLVCAPHASAANALSYSVTGVGGKIRDNVNAWLGAQPETVPERVSFVLSARERAENSLKALGYYDALIQIDVDETSPEWVMTVQIELNDPVRLRSVEVTLVGDLLNDEAFTTLLQNKTLKEGDILNHGKYDRFKRELQNLAQRRGYFDAKFVVQQLAVYASGQAADITLVFDGGSRYQFGSIEYQDDLLNEEQLDALLTFREGESYEAIKLQRFQSHLQSTGYFSSVVVSPLPAERESHVVPIELRTLAAKSHKIDLGVGYSTDTEERISMTWRTPRINRKGHSQETRVQWSPINPGGRFTYSIPLSHPLKDILQLSARLEENEYGDLDSLQQEFRIRREIKAESWIYSYSLRHLSESWRVTGEDRDNEYLLPGMTFSHKWREGSLVDPSEGFSQYYEIEVGNSTVASNANILRGYSDFVYVKSLSEKQRLVLRSELGAVGVPDSDRLKLPPSLNFFSGGAQSIRGYAYQSLGNEVQVPKSDGSPRKVVVGGTRLVVGSVEYQYYVNETWRASLFLDGGDAFDPGEYDVNYGA